MLVPNPHRRVDPFSLLELRDEAGPEALGPALQATRTRQAASGPGRAGGSALQALATPVGLAVALLDAPWRAPTCGLADEPADAWLAYRMALAAHRALWEREEAQTPEHHDGWVAGLEAVLRALGAPGLDQTLATLLAGAGLVAPDEEVEPLLRQAKADFLAETLLRPAAEHVELHPARYEVEAAHLQTLRTLDELGLDREAHDRYQRSVLRAASRLWLEVERPDRAATLLEELSRVEPGAQSVRHFLVRCRLLQELASLRKGALGTTVAPVTVRLEELADQAPYQWEVRTQLADLYLLYGRHCVEERRATDAGELAVKALVTDPAWPACAALAGDIEGSMHEARLVGSLGGGGMRDQIASEQLKSTIRAGFSRGELAVSRAKPYHLYETWPAAEAARLWFELNLPLDGGTFPAGCERLVEAVVDAPPLADGAQDSWSPELRQALAERAPELGEAQLDGPLARWVHWARSTRQQIGAPISVRDLLFLHRLRDRSPAAPPLGEGPWFRPVLGFSLRETAEGLLIEGIRPDGPAAAAGLAERDVLVRVRGFSSPTTARALSALLGWQPGEPLELVIRRQHKLVALQMQPTEQRDLDRLPQAEFKRRLEKLLNFRVDAELRVLSVPRVALFCQVKDGDVLQRLEGMPLRSVSELEQALRTVDMGQFLVFTVLRGGQSRLAKVVTLSFKEA